MTYDQIRTALSRVARFGDDGAPNELLPPARWMDLRTARCVTLDGERWRITDRGWDVLEEPRMPTVRPADRPVQRKSSRENRQQRRSA